MGLGKVLVCSTEQLDHALASVSLQGISCKEVPPRLGSSRTLKFGRGILSLYGEIRKQPQDALMIWIAEVIPSILFFGVPNPGSAEQLKPLYLRAERGVMTPASSSINSRKASESKLL